MDNNRKLFHASRPSCWVGQQPIIQFFNIFVLRRWCGADKQGPSRGPVVHIKAETNTELFTLLRIAIPYACPWITYANFVVCLLVLERHWYLTHTALTATMVWSAMKTDDDHDPEHELHVADCICLPYEYIIQTDHWRHVTAFQVSMRDRHTCSLTEPSRQIRNMNKKNCYMEMHTVFLCCQKKPGESDPKTSRLTRHHRRMFM